MKFIVDESTGTSVAEYLRNAGHDVLAVVESIPSAKDDDVLERAATESRILVTNDKDFGELVFRSQRSHAGIILLRLKEDSAATRVSTIHSLLQQYGDRLMGSFTVVSEDSVRIRPMSRLLP